MSTSVHPSLETEGIKAHNARAEERRKKIAQGLSYRESFGLTLPGAGTKVTVEYCEGMAYNIIWDDCPDGENILYGWLSKEKAAATVKKHNWITKSPDDMIDIHKLREGKVYSLHCNNCGKDGLIFKSYFRDVAEFRCKFCSKLIAITMKKLAATSFKVGLYPPDIQLDSSLQASTGANRQNGHSTAAKGERVTENYPGNKYVQGLYHKIVNNIPQHHFYYELFAGSAAIATIKLPAPGRTVINDIDEEVAEKLRQFVLKNKEFNNWQVTNNNALDMLQEIILKPESEQKKIFVYLDPPYLGLKLYSQGHDMKTHQRLVQLAGKAKCSIMISHYKNPLYDNLVQRMNWRKETFHTAYHGKPVQECIYMNYPEPEKLHDYSLLGKDCWDRQRIKRKIDRWINKLNALPAQERNALVKTIKEKF